MTATVTGIHLGRDIHGNRPAANAAGQPYGALYSCSTHNKIYRSDGSTWSDWADATGGGISASVLTAKGSIMTATAASTPAELAVGANGTLVMAASAQSTGLKFVKGLVHRVRLVATNLGNADSTFNLNNAGYVAPAVCQFYMPWDDFPATHFLISAYGFANEVGQTVKAQFATQAAPGTPYSAAGDDLTITNNGGAGLTLSSGWVAMNSSPAGTVLTCVALKGSNATVDLTGRWIDVLFKVV
jgi:hypothetical protein